MTLTTTPVDGETGELHGVIYTYILAQNRWSRTALVATNAPGSIDTTDIAIGGVEPTNLNLAVIPASSPPPAPAVGPLYLITPTATGVWAGKEDQLATWDGAAWKYTTPTDGLIIWDSAADKLKAFDSDPAPGAWVIVNEYTPPAVPNSAAGTMRGNLTAVAAPEVDNGPQAVVDWLQASGAPFDDLKASILGTPGTTALNGANATFNILDRDLSAPPASPTIGDTYIVKATGTGAWAGKDGQFAQWNGTAWDFYPFGEGKLAWIADENILLGHDGVTPIQLFPPVATSVTLEVFAKGTATYDVASGTGATTINNVAHQFGGSWSVPNPTGGLARFTFASPRTEVDYSILGGHAVSAATKDYIEWSNLGFSSKIRFSVVAIGA
jgi:hypothetical protein